MPQLFQRQCDRIVVSVSGFVIGRPRFAVALRARAGAVHVVGSIGLALLLLAPGAGAVTYSNAATTFSWIDPAAHTAVTWSNGASCTAYAGAPFDDDITAPVNIGFNFKFGTTTYTTVQIMTNGRLQFGNKFCGFGTQSAGPPPTYPNPYPDGNLNNTMRIYGADLDLSTNGTGTTCKAATCSVRYTVTPVGTSPNRQFVVTWLNVPEWSQSTSAFNLQIILREDGIFTYQYGSSSNPSKGKAQVGWQLSTSDFAVPFTAIQANGTAVQFSPPTVAPSGLTVSAGATSASTCSPAVITVTAIDSVGAVVSSYGGTVTLSTSSVHGTWASASATGSFTAGSADSGTATYTFNGAGAGRDNGVASFNLNDSHADSLTITANDTAVSGLTATSAAISFQTNAFVVQPTDALGTTVVAGRSHAMKAELWQRDPSSGSCAIASAYTGTKPLDGWITRDVVDPGGSAPSIGGVTLPGAAAGGKGSDNLSMTFSAGTATFTLVTSDVGKYVVNLRDDTRVFATGTDITGATASVSARPFALSLESITSGGVANPAAATATGSVFGRAGANFSATVRGVLWQAADDPGNSGSPSAGANLSDNAVAPSFAWATTLAAAAPYAPAGGVLGTLNNGALAKTSFAVGTSAIASLQYTEVGSASLNASASTYLNTAGLNLTSPAVVVGRFTPAVFAVAANNPVFNAGCAGAGFTYLGAGMTYKTAPVLTVTAQNALGATTRNYTGSYWKLTNTSLTGKSYQTLTGSLNTSTVPATDPVIVDSGNGLGTLTFSTGSAGLSFVRAAPVAPFNAELALQVNVIDNDSIAFASNPARFGTATAGNGIAFDDGNALTTNDNQMLWGRLRLSSGFGSELLPVSVVAVVENFASGGAYVTNALDRCTPLQTAALTLSNALQTPAAGTTSIKITVAADTTAALANSPAQVGLSAFVFSAPGASNTGYTLLSYDLISAGTRWLQFDWGGIGVNNQNPTARADFGIFAGPRAVIYSREPW